MLMLLTKLQDAYYNMNMKSTTILTALTDTETTREQQQHEHQHPRHRRLGMT